MYLFLILTLLLAVSTDVLKRKIPNLLIIFGLVSGLILQLSSQQGLGFVHWGIGVLVGFVCLFPLYALRGMAAGDVKLMMVVGGFVGFPLVLIAALYSFVAGGVMAIIICLAKGRFKEILHNIKNILTSLYIKLTSGVNIDDGLSSQADKLLVSGYRMPYALAIAIGTLLALYFELKQSAIITN